MTCEECSKNKKEYGELLCKILNINKFLQNDYTVNCPCKQCIIMIACTKNCDNFETYSPIIFEEYEQRVTLSLKKEK